MKPVITLILLLLVLVPYRVQANTYYVATNGNDANQGIETQPWKTIQKAANTLVAGDTVFIKAGIYNERVIIKNSGTLNNEIVFSNYQNDTVIIDGDSISWGGAWNGLFDISNRSYIHIMGLRIKNADYSGFWIEDSDHIIIEDNYTYNTYSSGIGVWSSSYITIKNNEIELACNDGEQECITIANSDHSAIFKNNVHNNGLGTIGGEGIDVKAGSHDIDVYQNEVHHLNNRLGIYADAWDSHTYNINIYQNIIHHCSETGLAVASESGGLIENVAIFNNIIYSNKYGGIELGSWSDIGFTGPKPLKHIKIINNTCYQNGVFNNGWGFGIVVDNPDAKDVIIRNNICSENSAQIAIQQIDSGGVVDHNLLFGNNTASGTLYGSDSIISDPHFVDTLTYNFHLLSISPAIDKGSPLNAPTTDFDNNNRPSGLNFDIGAYEYGATANIQEHSAFDIKVALYPNPVFDQLNVKIEGDKYRNYTLRIFDINGKLVRITQLSKTKKGIISIDINDLISGLYIINLSTDNQLIINKKLIFK